MDSLCDQLRELTAIASREGMHKAADYLTHTTGPDFQPTDQGESREEARVCEHAHEGATCPICCHTGESREQARFDLAEQFDERGARWDRVANEYLRGTTERERYRAQGRAEAFREAAQLARASSPPERECPTCGSTDPQERGFPYQSYTDPGHEPCRDDFHEPASTEREGTRVRIERELWCEVCDEGFSCHDPDDPDSCQAPKGWHHKDFKVPYSPASTEREGTARVDAEDLELLRRVSQFGVKYGDPAAAALVRILIALEPASTEGEGE